MLNFAFDPAQANVVDPAVQAARMASFQAELDEVAQQLATMSEELYAPLSELLRAEIKQAQPLVRAAFVLTASIEAQGNEQRHPADAQLVRQKRIWLAAALETLTVALHIHKLLFRQQQRDHTVDKSLMGSVILAGDYCFSRAASLAARTAHPEVVTIFSRALMSISEGHLRQLHSPEELPQTVGFDEGYELISYGLQAATILAKMDTPTQQQVLGVGEQLARQLSPVQSTLPYQVNSPIQLATNLLPSYQQPYWLLLRRWLSVVL
jgi:geranylgeranyl pyrophosphate synthase